MAQNKLADFWNAKIVAAIDKTGLQGEVGTAAYRALQLEALAAIRCELDTISAMARKLADAYTRMADAYGSRK